MSDQKETILDWAVHWIGSAHDKREAAKELSELRAATAERDVLKQKLDECEAELATHQTAVKFAVEIHGNESEPERKIFVPQGEKPVTGAVTIKIHARDYPAGSTVWVSAFKPVETTKESS